jgi:hypothetical protein
LPFGGYLAAAGERLEDEIEVGAGEGPLGVVRSVRPLAHDALEPKCNAAAAVATAAVEVVDVASEVAVVAAVAAVALVALVAAVAGVVSAAVLAAVAGVVTGAVVVVDNSVVAAATVVVVAVAAVVVAEAAAAVAPDAADGALDAAVQLEEKVSSGSEDFLSTSASTAVAGAAAPARQRWHRCICRVARWYTFPHLS